MKICKFHSKFSENYWQVTDISIKLMRLNLQNDDDDNDNCGEDDYDDDDEKKRTFQGLFSKVP